MISCLMTGILKSLNTDKLTFHRCIGKDYIKMKIDTFKKIFKIYYLILDMFQWTL